MQATIPSKKELRAHGYFTYPCGGGKYALHAIGGQKCGRASFRGAFKTRREAFVHAATLPKN